MEEYAKLDIHWILYNQIEKLQKSRNIKIKKWHNIQTFDADKKPTYQKFTELFLKYKYLCVEFEDEKDKVRHIDERVIDYNKDAKWRTLAILANYEAINARKKVEKLFKTVLESKEKYNNDVIIIVPNNITTGMIKNITSHDVWKGEIVQTGMIKYASFRANPEEHILLDKKITILENTDEILKEIFAEKRFLKRERVESPLAIWTGCVKGDVICVDLISPVSMYQREYYQII